MTGLGGSRGRTFGRRRVVGVKTGSLLWTRIGTRALKRFEGRDRFHHFLILKFYEEDILFLVKIYSLTKGLTNINLLSIINFKHKLAKYYTFTDLKQVFKFF